MTMLPPSRPNLTHAEVTTMAQQAGVNISSTPLLLVGLRGYYRDSMGKSGVNDRNLYDDGFALIGPGGYFKTFNGNTDPAKVRVGKGFGPGKGMGQIMPGLYHAHQYGFHKGKYAALVQSAGPLEILRDGNPSYVQHNAWGGFNIHKGGETNTFSAGCQTLPPTQYEEFMTDMVTLLRRVDPNNWKLVVVPYLLLDPNASAGTTPAFTALREGSQGEQVAELQRLLKLSPPDGWFGPKTEEAVRKFQAAHKLTVDGLVGPKTWAALRKRD